MRTKKLKLLLIIFYLINLESICAETDKSNAINLKDNLFSSMQINESQKSEISKIQKKFKIEIDNINANFIEKREELNDLVTNNATNDELQNKIQEITALKSKQLWLIIKNRRTIEGILGKEKNQQFLSMARQRFLEHNKKFKKNTPPVPLVPPLP